MLLQDLTPRTDKNPVPPWIYRHRTDPTTVQPNTLEPSSPGLVTTPNLSNALSILGNRRSLKYHRPDCPSYDLFSPKNRVPFNSSQEAEEAGFVLAGNCPH